MRLRVKNAGNARVLELHGHLTLGDGDVVIRDAVRQIVDEGHANLVFNMKHVTRLDSSGIGEMMACLTHVKRKGGNIHLLLPPDHVLAVLGIVGLRLQFPTFSSELEAVGSFARSA